MDYNETWGVSCKRISEFFSSQADIEKTGALSFRYMTALISLTELPEKRLYSIHIPQTRVQITGGEDADTIHYRFYIRFLSAGG